MKPVGILLHLVDLVQDAAVDAERFTRILGDVAKVLFHFLRILAKF